MMLRRFLPAAFVSAGLAASASAQDTPAKPATPDAPANSSTVPAPNPDVDKAIESIQQGKIDEALKHLEEAAKKDKKFPLPKVKLAELFLSANNQQAAQLGRQYLEQASAENKDHPDPFILSARIALAEGRVMDAMLLFEYALNKASSPALDVSVRPRFVRTCREGLAQCYRSRGEYQKAKEQLEQILADEPTNAVVRKNLAFLVFVFGEPDKAFEQLKQAFKDDANNLEIGLPEVNMAQFWKNKPITATTDEARKTDELENAKKSEEWMQKALKEHAKDVRSAREYARWLLNAGRDADADKQLAAAKAIDANDDETAALMGLSLRYKKQHEEAEKIFAQLNLKKIDNLAYAWNLALCRAESKEKEKRENAVKLAEIYMNNQPRNPEGMCILGWCYLKADRFDDAEKMFNAAVQSSGGRLSPDSIFFLCKLMEKRGKGKEAVERMKVAVDSKDAFVYRKEAEAFYKELTDKHGKPEDKKKDEKKDEKKEEKKEEKKP